ncbi:MAG: FeoB-associated Cys-rich membrane protein [Verrucomicrobia bacterium]|nr:FeoB-associated Cys-rich membrane protein [Verrucomicrobiota bacterium]
MSGDWQTLAAGAVVAITALVFLIRLSRPRKSGGCGGNCQCGKRDHRH